MRRNALPSSIIGSIALSATMLTAAYAATVTVTSTSDFNSGDVESNTRVAGGSLTVDTIDNTYGEWIRKPYDGGATWGMELQKDSASTIWGTDSCIDPSDNGGIGNTLVVNGTTYRTGTLDTDRSLLDGAILPFDNVNQISEIRFLTHGARTADPANVPTPTADYTVTVTTSTGSSVFTIPIESAAETSRTTSGSGTSFGSWSKSGWSDLVSDASNANCVGDEGDEVIIDLGGFEDVVEIQVDYQDEANTTDDDTVAGESWLGGPFAMVTDAIEEEVEVDFTWRATYRSAVVVADAVDAGGNAFWYDASWNTSSVSTDTDVFLRVRCGYDTNGNGTVEESEWKDQDGGTAGAWQDPINLATASSGSIERCEGRFLQYELEFYPEFDVAPLVDDITFTYNPDSDGDGYPTDLVAGHPTPDCDDGDDTLNWDDADTDGFSSCTSPAPDCDDTDGDVYPGASLVAADVEDGIDHDCDGREECFADGDTDGFGGGSIVNENPSSINFVCDASGESGTSDDCDDTDGGIFPGATIGSGDVADGVDRDCDGQDECYFDGDDDGFGDGTVVNESTTDGDNVCTVGAGEATNPQVDCDDGDGGIYPGATISGSDVADGVDRDCDGGDECYFDGDNDGHGVNSVVNEGAPVDLLCNGNQEAAAVDFDCDDTDGSVNPSATVSGSDVGDGIDRDCNGSEECFRDQDEDGFGTPTIIDESGDADLACETIDGESTLSNDCDDNPITGDQSYPGKTIGASDIADGRNNNCDLGGHDECWTDADNDSYGDEAAIFTEDTEDNGCRAVEGQASVLGDCNDGSAIFNPGIDDTCTGFGGDGQDNNCDGAPFDDDGDGLLYVDEVGFNTNDCSLDSDADGLNDSVEYTHFCGVASAISLEGDNPDTDGDGVEDGDEELESDSDSDGIKNPCDPDDDGDGIPTSVELAYGDTDGDGIDDYLDPDDDDDGIPTSVERGGATSAPFPNFDNDGLADYRDDDDDNDGIPTLTELSYVGYQDADGDGEANHRDLDSDGDGYSDATEHFSAQGPNYDGDALPDFLDEDSDNDLVPDAQEIDQDRDGDGRRNRVDEDDDGDGINTAQEGSDQGALPAASDFDGTGGPNYLDTDSDGDGWSDNEEWTQATSGRDSDGDGSRDFLDLDSDNDLLPDAQELDLDADNDGRDNRVDEDDDGDGINTAFEMGSSTPNPGWNTFSGAADNDCSAAVLALTLGACPDYLDDDDDDDGIPTANEVGGTFGSRAALLAGARDSDSGSARSDDGTTCGLAFAASCPDYLDPDDDNDGLLTIDEPRVCGAGGSSNADFDNDGLPDHRDEDDDNDGVLTEIELAGPPDADGDGNCNHRDIDADNDGYSDAHEYTVGGVDFDSDGTPDFLDTDSDNDGVLDVDESGDTDGTELENRVDVDDDGDHIPTAVERTYGNTDASFDVTDTTPDYLDADDDNDGIPTFVEIGSPAGLLSSGFPNTDGSGLPDHRDEDDDDDTLLTRYEQSFTGNLDVDGDGISNHKDDDSDGDGYSDQEEENGPHGPNADGNGLPDFLDTDSDDDLVPDADEVDTDTDGDGRHNRVDADDDGDGILTRREGSDSGALPAVSDFDGSGGPNYLDLDSDNDGYSDAREWTEATSGRDSDGDGARDFLDLDSDDDGLPDAQELDLDADGDSLDNRVDEDDDGDGLPTLVEMGPSVPNAGWNTFSGSEDNDCVPAVTSRTGGICPDYLDPDDDDDGIATADELALGNTGPFASWNAAMSGAFDTDRTYTTTDDGTTCGRGPTDSCPDYVDPDDDNDNILTRNEPRICGAGGSSNPDFDNDGLPDHRDEDDDGDGLLTRLELAGNPDVDADGDCNHRDVDADNDGYSDAHENSVGGTDFDSDGTPDYLDSDSDNDGIADLDESGDTDGTELENRVDIDDDGDHIPTATERTLGNTDASYSVSDSIPDYLDNDDDNDGIPTFVEIGSPSGMLSSNFPNSDGDSLPDHRDEDDDDDGLLTRDELSFSDLDVDNDGDQNHLDTDSDGDGYSDAEESQGNPNLNTDGADLPDFLDTDSDNDLVPDADEQDDDSDEDGAHDRVDNDDDGDGIPTRLEASASATPPLNVDDDGDGVPNYLDEDSDDDGWSDEREWNEIRPGASGRDSDGDGTRDFQDLDSDDDTVPDAQELDLDADGTGGANRVDADDDGDEIPTRLELGTTGNPAFDTFNTPNEDDCTAAILAETGGICPDYLDPDDDDDGRSTRSELRASGGDVVDFSTRATLFGSALDTDLNYDASDVGTDCRRGPAQSCPDYIDPDDDNDGLLTRDEPLVCVSSTGVVGTPGDDFDGDGLPDYRDEDDDGDGLLTAYELSLSQNTDDDGDCNHRDIDADNDLFPDAHEADIGGPDFDGDGTPDFLDTDSDNDGIPDILEWDAAASAPLNSDQANPWPGMGGLVDLEDRVDADDDNDGVPTALEGRAQLCGDSVGVCGSAVLQDNDWDDDGIPDYLDPDDDGDGIATLAERLSPSAAAAPYAMLPADQTWATLLAGERDFDGDGRPDFVDRDDDGDGIPSIEERLCADPATPPVDVTYDGTNVVLTVHADPDGDGFGYNNDLDDDGDTLPTAEEQLHGGRDADGDNCYNAYELDSDDDGWPDEHEGLDDDDGDFAADFVDTDSDGDSVPDAFELNPYPNDPTYLGGVWDYGTHSWTELPPDSDGDGIEDRLDIDDDDDEIPTLHERFLCSEGDRGDALADSVWVDLIALRPFLDEVDCVEFSSAQPASEDHPGSYDWDGDGLWNYLDDDDDDDGVPTALEDYDYTHDTNALYDHDGDPITPVVAVPDPGPEAELVSNSPSDVFDLGSFARVDDGDPAADKNDTDVDGAPDFLDVDDDDDGVATLLEAYDGQSPWDTNSNPHGDPDDLLDVHPRQYGDNLPDFLDPDDDGDGIATVDEDLNDDGDPRNDNSNPEGGQFANVCSTADAVEPGCWDEVPDFRDVDDEGDGVPTWAENLLFGQAAGQPYDVDADNDGVIDGREWINTLPLAPLGSIPSTRQVTIDEFAGLDVAPAADRCGADANLDGIPDRIEDVGPGGSPDGVPDMLIGRWWFEPWDRDCDGVPNFDDTDDDDDGLLTGQNLENEDDLDCLGVLSGEGDGIPNYVDIDSDNETITVAPGVDGCDPSTPLPGCVRRTDAEEGLGDQDGDGYPDFVDCDDNGPFGDSDYDRIPNYLEDNVEGNAASVCNQFALYRSDSPNWPPEDCGDVNRLVGDSCHQSPDSDCDGILDCQEAGILASDAAGNPVDLDGNGLFDDYDPDPCASDVIITEALLPRLRDTDGDQVPDMFDRDDDGDGIGSVYETTFTRVANGGFESTCGTPGATVGPWAIGPLETTGGGFGGWRWFCVSEGQQTGTLVGGVGDQPWEKNTDAPGVALVANPDSIFDYLDEDDDGDSRNGLERSTAAEDGQGPDDGTSLAPNFLDQDNDGIPNWLDPYDFDGPTADADLDGIPNSEEAALGLSPYSDDSDGDGIPDALELGSDLTPLDTDGDGTIDALDEDDDGDGVPSVLEGMGDQDDDGVPNFRDTDSDDDGIPDGDEIGEDGSLIDSDCDGLADIFDDTDDGDVFCITDTGVGPVDEGCGGCSSSGPGGLAGVLGLFTLALMRRRR